MMTSTLLSRLLPSNPTGRSIYEDLRAHDEASDVDVEERAGLALDERNLQFHDDELASAEVFNGEDSHLTTESTAFLGPQRTQINRANRVSRGNPQGRQPKWVAQSPRLLDEDAGDDDVPASLLIEDHDTPGPSAGTQRLRQSMNKDGQTPMPGPSNKETRAQWEAAQAQQRLHKDDNIRGGPQPVRHNVGLLMGSPREKAMWRWINVMNLDTFMKEVYEYYNGAGVWCILLARALNLAQLTFVAIFVTFLTQCIDYHSLRGSQKLSDVLIPQCTRKISGPASVAIWLFTLFLFYRIYDLLMSIPHLLRIRDFYLHLLEIPDSDMQTVSWQDVVARIMALRDANPTTVERATNTRKKWLGSQSKQRLDAHDIANRLMRKENYLIALFNKDILDLSLPFPFLHDQQLFTRALLWNLDYSIMGFLFNDSGQVKQLVLKDSHRKELCDGLRRRFVFAGCVNALFAPILVVYLTIVFFFKYFNEYQKNPASIGVRQYTLLAEWKFREFNELDHLFRKRINMSYPFASRYLDQFPKIKTVHVARFVAFVSGSIVSVLAVASLLDPDLFLGFEITPEKTVLFYLGVFGALWGFMNGSIPEENLVFEPEYALRNVIEYTHYMPNSWQDRLHSDDVKREFAALYQLKIVVFLTEVFSILITPFILWFSLPKCSDQIVDFFREFTIHVDGLGYVCSFAVFDFKKGDGRRTLHGGGHADARDEYYSTKHGKMAASYYGFLDNYLLNPKTAVQGHVPPGARHNFHPPPAFPGLMSPTLAAEMQTSRMGRSERRPGSRAPGGLPPSTRTPRFAPTGGYGSPIQSILLDPHHQPSTSGFAGRSTRRTSSRSRYQARQNIAEEPMEDEEEPKTGRASHSGGNSRDPYESVVGLDESRWELSPTRVSKEANEDEVDGPGEGGILGLLYQIQKARTDIGGGINI